MKFVVAILNSTEQPGHVFVMSFHSRDFVHMAFDKPFNYHSGLWLLFSHIIFEPLPCSILQNDNIADSEVDNCL